MGNKKDPAKEAAKVQREQLARLSKISLPELEQLALEAPELVGLLQEQQLGDSAMEDIRIDPSLLDAQKSALRDLQESGKVGLTPEDRARLNQVKRETEADAQARQKGILQGMAERGQMDSGAQLIAQLQSSGQATTDAAAAGERLAAEAASARRQALQQAGGMAGQMAQQQFGQQAQVSGAKDAINQFNLQQRAQTQQMNLGARQNIENQRAGISNQNQSYNKQIAQQQFQNEMSKAGAQGQASNALATSLASQKSGPSFGQVLGTVGGGVAGFMAGGGPMGAVKGASAGAQIGGIFKDGGLVKRYENGGPVVDSENFLDTLRASSNSLYPRDNYVEKMPEQISQDNPMSPSPISPSPTSPISSRPTSPINHINAEEQKKIAELSAMTDSMFKKPVSEITKQPNVAVIGQDNDATSNEINTDEKAKEVIADSKEDKESKFDKDMADIEELNKNLEGEKRLNLKYDNTPYALPQNTMQTPQAMQFANPFSAEDGGIADQDALQGLENLLGQADFTSSGNGDIIDSGQDSYADDRIDAKVNDGEAILNIPQQQRFMDMIRGKISPDELGDEDIIEGVPKDYRDELHDKVDKPKKSDRELKIEGLENLLKALGK